MPSQWIKKITSWIKDPLSIFSSSKPQKKSRTRISEAKKNRSPGRQKTKVQKMAVAKKLKPPATASKKAKAKKTNKKTAVRKIKKSGATGTVPKKSPPPQVAPVSKKEAASGIFVGKITHYFPKAGAAVLRVEKAEIKTGAKILIKGTNTSLKMAAASIQINRIPVPSGKPGEDIGIGVTKPVEPGDSVYLL